MFSGAPVYDIVDEKRARAEAAAWSHFTAPADDVEFFSAWLALSAARIDRIRAALLLTTEAEGGSFGVAAAWPDSQRDLQYLGEAAQRALGERTGIVMAPDGEAPAADGPAHVGYPIEVGGQLVGAVVLDVGPGTSSELQNALRQLHWASAWLVDHFRQRQLAEREAELARVGSLNELMASALQHRRLHASALAVANELAMQLCCDRVSVGFENHAQIEPLALSHAASFDKRSDLVRSIAAAMDEVLDLGVALVLPAPPDDELGAIAHAETMRELNVQALMSVPVLHESQTIGVITFERNDGPAFTDNELGIARALGVMLAPTWALQRAKERPWWRRVRDASRAVLQATIGPSNPGLKLIASVLAFTLVAMALMQADHRVTARTVIEGSTQLASVAPFDGIIAEGFVHAGDTVRSGQPMARLDDRDLNLERARWTAEREQLQHRLRVAMAKADRGAMRVIAAQINQSEAQLALAQSKLTRATLIAPFDGVIVAGDLRQSIGTPVEQGKVLFEVAPLEGYRAVLQVDDRDIARLALEQHGELVLSSLPEHALPFTVSAITPVAIQMDGRNLFRVEARIDGSITRLRPGMEGVGKVVVGERSLLWIWTHSFFDWLRLALWNLMP